MILNSTKTYNLKPTTCHGSLSRRGVTLIDTIVGTALLLVVFLGIIGVFRLSVDVVSNNKARAGALALANERVEYVRGLTYDQVGTVGGIPAGVIPQTESVTLNGIAYTRRTYVQYADDAADGIGAADSNSRIADYKVARVNVFWPSSTGERHIVLLTRISPPGEESNVPGGTLSISVTNSLSEAVSNAQVHVVNTGTTPPSQAIDFTTYTNTAGIASFIGATSTGAYQITVTKPGYTTDQTYSVTAENTAPDPGHLAVENNQTTSWTFRIDTPGQKTIRTYTRTLIATSTDTFADSNSLATTSNVTVAGGTAHLIQTEEETYPSLGTLQSVTLAPSDLVRWKTLSWSESTPGGTDVVYRVYGSDGVTLIPDAQLPGNAAGFSSSPVSLLGISTTTNSGIRLGASLSSSGESTPSIDVHNIVYEYGPVALPNIDFNVRGDKRIGSGPSGTLYKYDEDHDSGSGATVVIEDFEWDRYLITVPATTGYDIASVCHPPTEYLGQPESVALFDFPAGVTTESRLHLAPHTTHSVRVDVRSATGVHIPNATVTLSRVGFSSTDTTDACGQAFFGGLSELIYTVDVSAPGFTPDSSAANVDGATQVSVTLD